MLQVQQVRKSFGERVVVDDVSFEVHDGEIFALLGPNGAGKTTLLRMITNLLVPDSGSILLDGKPVGSAAGVHVAYLPEERGLYRRVPILEGLMYQAELKGMSAPAARAQAGALLDEFGLAAWAAKPGAALSKGMQQKVQLCTALIGDARLLILDEPFTGLDPVNVVLLEAVLARRRAAGTIVLLSTHQMSKVEQQCDRALLLDRGRTVLLGTVREMRLRYAANMVRVEGDDVPAGIPGVASMARDRGAATLQLAQDALPGDVLAALVARGVRVTSFLPVVPPLEDIFVHVVSGGAR